jgi:hypothetical protein
MSTQEPAAPELDPLRELNLHTFVDCIGDPFRIAFSDGEVELSLAEANSIVAGHSEPEAEQRQPFSLIFRGGPPDRYLPQSTYALEHAALGTLPMFLVPLGPDKQGMRYEAIFT